MCLIVAPKLLDRSPSMQCWIKPDRNFTPITTVDDLVVTTENSPRLLATLGILGEIEHTSEHSADSVSLVLNSGIAFTGDLPPMSTLSMGDPHVLAESWQ